MVPDSFALFTCLVKCIKIERTIEILLSMRWFFRWSEIDLSSNWIIVPFLHCRHCRPKGEKVNSSSMEESGLTMGGKSPRLTTAFGLSLLVLSKICFCSLKREVTCDWDTYRPQQSLMRFIFCNFETSQPFFWQCRSALSFLNWITCPQIHE